MKVFLSYASLSRGFASTLYEDLRLLGFEGWIDLLEMPSAPTRRSEDDIKAALRAGLESCDCALQVINDAAMASDWVRWERSYAAELSLSRSTFQLIPLLYEPTTAPVPRDLAQLDPIDFSNGYNTALSRVLARLGVHQPALGISLQRSIGSRQLTAGQSVTDHVIAEVDDEWTANLIASLTERFAVLELSLGAYDRLLALRNHALGWLPEPDILLGNSWEDPEDNTSSDRLVLSAFPNPAFSGNESGDGVLFATSLYRDGTALQDTPDCTLACHFTNNGAGYLWLAWRGLVHHYTVGDARHPGRLLLGNYKMGAVRHAFVLPVCGPSSSMIALLQGAQNKHGDGLLAAPIESILRTQLKLRGAIARTLERAAAQQWTTPVLRQEQAIASHLATGGLLPFEIHPATGLSAMMARQLIHLLTCAGAVAIDEHGKSDYPRGPAQWLSVSSLQRDLL